MNSRKTKAIKFLFICLASLYIAKELLLIVSCELSYNIGTHLNAYRLVRELNKIPRSYYSEKRITSYDFFVTKYLSDFPRLQDYKYSTEIAKNAIFNQAFETVSRRDICVKKVAPLLSVFLKKEKSPGFTVIGAIFFEEPQKAGTYKEIVCQSKIPGWQTLNKPYLQGKEPTCGEGTTKFVQN